MQEVGHIKAIILVKDRKDYRERRSVSSVI